jgi:GlcNAc-P-P-Und epimerase
MNSKVAVLFGGSGFIGSYLAAELLQENIVSKIVIADHSVNTEHWPAQLKKYLADGLVQIVTVDVREPINSATLPDSAELIVNLAAVHREPGHEPHEYFATNLPGAENICNWARQINCKQIIFTSSIAVYGASEDINQQKDEFTLPMPNTPYGISKLVAEKIHQAWQLEDSSRKLIIVRPGVIFGPGEKGNVTRMVRGIRGNYFMFSGNKEMRKAGGYVKELCSAIIWMYQQQQQTKQGSILFNFSMDPTPTMSEYANAIQQTLGKHNYIPSMPLSLLMVAATGWSLINKILGKSTDINPTRISKLRRSNYIVPKVLVESGYQYKYDLKKAMEDWKQENLSDWK